MAAVLVHIDLDGDLPHASSLQALAARRAVASSWGATLYAAVVVHDASERSPSGAPPPGAPVQVPGDARTIEAIRAALARGGADKIVVALTEAPIEPLWCALGAAWQAVLDRLRPRLVVFGADAPSADELGPRTAARIGARLFLRARTLDHDEVELRDRDGSYVRTNDSGAAVALIGAAPRLDAHGDDDIDVTPQHVAARECLRVVVVVGQRAAPVPGHDHRCLEQARELPDLALGAEGAAADEEGRLLCRVQPLRCALDEHGVGRLFRGQLRTRR